MRKPRKPQKLIKTSVKDQVKILRQQNRLLKSQLRELQEQYDSLLWEYKQYRNAQYHHRWNY